MMHIPPWIGTAAPVVALVALAFGTPDRGVAQDAGDDIFRLVTFEAGGDMRLGATAGTGSHDILDVHNGIRWLIEADAPEARALPYVPADMRTLIEAGPRSATAVRQVYRALAARKASGTFNEPGGAARVFHPATAVTILTLALAIGANTAMFGVIESVLRQPLPYRNPERMVWITQNTLSGANRLAMVIGSDLEQWRNRVKAFETLSVLLTTDAMLAGEEPTQVRIACVSAGVNCPRSKMTPTIGAASATRPRL